MAGIFVSPSIFLGRRASIGSGKPGNAIPETRPRRGGLEGANRETRPLILTGSTVDLNEADWISTNSTVPSERRTNERRGAASVPTRPPPHPARPPPRPPPRPLTLKALNTTIGEERFKLRRVHIREDISLFVAGLRAVLTPFLGLNNCHFYLRYIAALSLFVISEISLWDFL